MAIMTEAIQDRISVSLRMTRWDILCFHTIVGYDTDAPHFVTKANGDIVQKRDTAFQSAANYQGNPRCLAVETVDHGPEFGNWNTNDGHAVPAWTDAQCWSNAELCVWAHRTHGIPLFMAPNSKPGSRGVAYHRMGVDSPNGFAGYAYPGRVSGGELWTKYAGKVCPGDRRINQLINVVLPRARILAGYDVPLEEEVDILGPNMTEFQPTGGTQYHRWTTECGGMSQVVGTAYFAASSAFHPITAATFWFTNDAGEIMNTRTLAAHPKDRRAYWPMPDGCTGVSAQWDCDGPVSAGPIYMPK